MDIGNLYHERQHNLRSRWGFDCTCELCSSSVELRASSDRRRQKIRTMRQDVMKHVQHKNFIPAIKLNEELLGLIAKENMAPHMGEHYEVIARLYLAAMDLANAKRFARLALDELEANGGREVYDSISELEALLEWN